MISTQSSEVHDKKMNFLDKKSEGDLRKEDEDKDPTIAKISTDKRWQRRSTKINLIKDGSFTTHLAVDLVSGREVLWNTINLNDKNYSEKQRKAINDNLAALGALKSFPYVADYLAFWLDPAKNVKDNSLKIYLITENFGSVSLYHFLNSIKTNIDHVVIH